MKRTIRKTAAFLVFMALLAQFVYFDVPKPVLADDDQYETPSVVSAETGDDSENDSIWLYDDATIKALEVPDGVRNVTINSTTMEKITLPSSVQNLYLSYCPLLKEVNMTGTSETNTGISIYCCDKLEKISLNGVNGDISIVGSEVLTSLDLSSCTIGLLEIRNCDKLEKVKLGKKCESISLESCHALKKFQVPKDTSYIYLVDIDFDNIIIKDNNYGYSVKNGALYKEENGIKTLKAVDFHKKTIDVENGTIVIDFLNLSGNFYSIETINLPDSVEKIEYMAFYGGYNLKNINISKNCITMSSYAFTGLNKDVEITIPESTKFVSGTAFYEFPGSIKVEKNTDYIKEYEGGIYSARYDFSEKGFALVYYPSDKTNIKFSPDTIDIGLGVFKDSNVKALTIPEGALWVDFELYNAFNLKSISIPASVIYIDGSYLQYAPALTKLTVSPDNEDYASYKNCLYDKRMTTLLGVPGALENVVIPEGVLSLGYYTVNDHYVNTAEDDYRLVQPTVTFPRSLEHFENYYISNAKVYADTPIMKDILSKNEETAALAEEYGITLSPIYYTILDTNKELLNMIYVIDEVSVKKGEKTKVTAELPAGVNSVSKLTLGNKKECLVRYYSSDTNVAKVNKKTGKITGVNQGTCTINVKCTIDNGKKKNSKTFKIKLKVK